MRVGYVLKKFPRISETFVLDEVLELGRQGVEVTVFSLNRPDEGRFHRKLADLRAAVHYLVPPRSQELLDRLADAAGDLHRGRDRLWEEFQTLLTARRRDLWTVLRQGIEIGAAVRRQGIDHLHAHFATVATDVARIAAATAGVSYSFTCHAKDIYREGVDPERFRRLVAGARSVVTVCRANRRYILDHLAPDAGERIRAVYNGVDLERLHPRVRRPQTVPLVLGVGRLVEKKGFDDLVRAVAMLQRSGRQVRCAILGDGDRHPSLEALCRELGADVDLVGATTEEETLGYMARATLLALPCVVGADGNRDALPTVLLEAMACGLPVVSTPIVGVEEIVGGGEAGVLVPPRAPSALAQAIGELLDHPDRRAALAGRGRDRARRLFDLGRNVGELRAAFGGAGPVGRDAAAPALATTAPSATELGEERA